MSYEIIKALHIISVIAWMAGLLYLPRLFVYHADTPLGSVQAETFKVMERRLLKAIMTPAMITSFIFGIWMLVLVPALLTEIWMIIKIVCVFGLAGCHGLFSRMRRDLENDKLPYSSKVYRIWNEAPTLLMIIVVIMAVVKPDFT
ncbi:MAG TPA: protoporphyrinogen oxidase HemJ [Alphaproteobacteria bacterium]|jgi:putative membrane protein|nr:protoporphyrinogen oxidase HemJ [Alphaproteobacteria bacterium]|tara:strand:+ start:897 stop:1331 length:435 start_codon:yes stop_codon:yes gene_type:complete